MGSSVIPGLSFFLSDGETRPAVQPTCPPRPPTVTTSGPPPGAEAHSRTIPQAQPHCNLVIPAAAPRAYELPGIRTELAGLHGIAGPGRADIPGIDVAPPAPGSSEALVPPPRAARRRRSGARS